MPANARTQLLGFALIVALYAEHSTAQTMVVSGPELDKMRAHLSKVNADPVFTGRVLKNARGRRIDCVDFEEQPGMRYRKQLGIYQKIDIPTPTTETPLSGFTQARPEPMFDENDTVPTDIWSDEASNKAQVCAPGTVPIPRMELSELTKYPTLADYFKNRSRSVTTRDPTHFDGPGTGHWHAGVRQDTTNWGATASFNLWSPTLRESDAFSLVEVSLGSLYTPGRPSGGAPGHTLELVFKKSPSEYGDSNVHLELCATKNGYTVYCINNDCANYIGYVHYSNTVALGTSFGPTSTYQGSQYYVNLGIMRANGLPLLISQWLLMVGSQAIGTIQAASYYNANGSSDLAYNAPRMHLYGEVYSQASHLVASDDMGSGYLPTYAPTSGWDGFGAYAWISQMRYNSSSGTVPNLTPISNGYIETDNQYCYNAAYANNPDVYNWYIYYGGNGWIQPNCWCDNGTVNSCP